MKGCYRPLLISFPIEVRPISRNSCGYSRRRLCRRKPVTFQGLLGCVHSSKAIAVMGDFSHEYQLNAVSHGSCTIHSLTTSQNRYSHFTTFLDFYSYFPLFFPPPCSRLTLLRMAHVYITDNHRCFERVAIDTVFTPRCWPTC